MHSRIRTTDGGLLIENDKTKIFLDPSKVESNNFVFISHAHSDHVYRKPKNKTRIKTITSIETEAIAKARGYEITNTIYEEKDLELIDSGHILGSKGLLAFNEIFYTGDISIRKRAFLNPPQKIPQVDTLIIESTFGRPEYIFPDHNKITLGFSGWACNQGYNHMMGIDYALPMSDHCYYNELIQVVKKCNPKNIFTIHGFAHEFARRLNNMGYNANPLENHANKIRNTRKDTNKSSIMKTSSIRKKSNSSINNIITN